MPLRGFESVVFEFPKTVKRTTKNTKKAAAKDKVIKEKVSKNK